MTPERWKKVAKLFRDALDRNTGERDRFIEAACQNDAPLRQEVLSLIAAHEQAGSFLERPAIQGVRTEETAGDGDGAAGPNHTFSVNQNVAGRFKIVRFIAQGGMGEVYQAWDTELQEPVALKTVRLAFANDEEAELRFKREIQLARKVTHPNVCRIFDLFHHQVTRGTGSNRYEGQVTFLTMELLCGETLAARLNGSRRMTTDAALPIILQIGAALRAAHEAGVVHRDLKPENVMLVRSSGRTRVVVTDFGLARGRRPNAPFGRHGEPSLLWTLHSIQAQGSKHTNRRLRSGLLGAVRSMSGDVSTALGAVMGTPGYMSPEQILGEKVDRRTDIFAFGVIIYQMMTGVMPYSTTSLFNKLVIRFTQRPRTPRKLNPEVPRHLEQVVLKCLETEPALRYQSADRVLADLESKRMGRVARARPFRLLLAIGGVMILSLAILLYFLS
jgi:serine/threonine protein kinase